MKKSILAIALVAFGVTLICLRKHSRAEVKSTVTPVSQNPTQEPDVLHEADAAKADDLLVVAAEAADYNERLRAVRSIGPNQSAQERNSLYKYLQSKPALTGLEKQRSQFLKNQILNALRAQEQRPPELTQQLVALYHDKAQDVVMRDYAIQNLSAWYDEAEDKSRIREILWEATGETDTSISGTALLSLARLSERHPEFHKSQIAQTALKIASDDSSGELVRITAVQVCVLLNNVHVASVALRLAQTATSIPLRISAIGALGATGGDEAKNFLVSALSEEALKPAAQAALAKLNQRVRS